MLSQISSLVVIANQERYWPGFREEAQWSRRYAFAIPENIYHDRPSLARHRLPDIIFTNAVADEWDENGGRLKAAEPGLEQTRQ